MNDGQVATIAALFSSAYPWAKFTEEQTILWMEMLADVKPEHSLEAAKDWIRTEDRPPSVAQFLERRRQLVDRPPELPALPPGSEPDTAELRERIADTRAVLAGAAAKAAKRLPKQVVDDAKAEVRRRGRDQRGPLVGCPDCRCPSCPYFEAPAEGAKVDA